MSDESRDTMWYVLDEGEGELGPFSRDQVVGMSRMGSVAPETMLRSVDASRHLAVAELCADLAASSQGGNRRRTLMWTVNGVSLVVILVVGLGIWLSRPARPAPSNTVAVPVADPPPGEARSGPLAVKPAPAIVTASGSPDIKANPSPSIAPSTAQLQGWQPIVNRMPMAIGTPDAFAVCSLRAEDRKRLKFTSQREDESGIALLVRFPHSALLEPPPHKNMGPPTATLVTEIANYPLSAALVGQGASGELRTGHPLDGLDQLPGGLNVFSKDGADPPTALVLLFMVPRWSEQGELVFTAHLNTERPTVPLPLSWSTTGLDQPRGDDWMMVALPERFDAVAHAARGSLLVFHPVGSDSLRIYDVAKRRIERSLPLPARDILLGAGSRYVAVYDRISRRLLKISLDDGKIIARFDLSSTVVPDQIDVEADDAVARLITYVPPETSMDHGIQRHVVSIALDSGRVVEQRREPLDPQTDRQAPETMWDSASQKVPATDNPKAILRVGDEGYLSLLVGGDAMRPIQIGNFPGAVRMGNPIWLRRKPAWMRSGSLRSEPIPSARRVLFLSERQELCCLPFTDRHVMHRTYDYAALLEKSFSDHIALLADNFWILEKTHWQHQLKQTSRWTDVTWSLEKGPVGMAVSPTGLITWDAPEVGNKKFVTHLISLSITPKGGKAQKHGLNVMVADETMYRARNANADPTQVQESPTGDAAVTDAANTEEGRKFRILTQDTHEKGALWLTDEQIAVAHSRDGTMTLVLHHDRLFHLDPGGSRLLKTVRLARPYQKIADRGDYVVALRIDGVDLIDRETGRVLREVTLLTSGTVDLALHPHQPLTYVSFVASNEEEVRYSAVALKIACVQERDGKVFRSPEAFGSRIAVSPDGKRLFAVLEGHCPNDFPLIKRFSPPHKQPFGNVSAVRLLLSYRLEGTGVHPEQCTGALDWHPSYLPRLHFSVDGRRLITTDISADVGEWKNVSGIFAWNAEKIDEKPKIVGHSENSSTGNIVLVPGGGVMRFDRHHRELIHVELDDAEAEAPKSNESYQRIRIADHFPAADGKTLLVLEEKEISGGQSNWRLRAVPIPAKRARTGKAQP